ncbi:c-type cytochrome [Neotabrizicola sp. VNH66]|uniref:c-type cytochrome n=1 Tax=Neotabrizicola sp. VNH66 TaxID=3400918 RepID=UPI003BFA9114
MRPVLLLLPLALAACLPQDKRPTGAEDFTTYCAACHGAGGMGDGELAGGLTKKPANLTTLAARNGGTFPKTKVMAKIWGYTGGKDSHAVMPQFGPLLESELVPYDGGDGIQTPTPVRLVQIAEYLQTLQR